MAMLLARKDNKIVDPEAEEDASIDKNLQQDLLQNKKLSR